MKTIEKKSSDNKYLHRDFHISMNILMGYITENFGDKALIEYLTRFAREFHKPRNESLKNGSLLELEQYFKDLYEKEEWPVDILLENDVLRLEQKACPGVTYIQKSGNKPIKQYIETYLTIYRTICEGTPYEYILEYYDFKSGACKQSFRRKIT